MNGPNESVVDKQLEDTERLLREYSTGLGLGNISYNSESDKALSLKQEDLKNMSAEECGQYTYILAQYAFFLQKEYNRENAKFKWASHNLNIVVGKQYGNYGDKYTKHEIKVAMVVNENEFAKKLNEIILNATLRITELDFVSSRVATMSSILGELQKTKRSDSYNAR